MVDFVVNDAMVKEVTPTREHVIEVLESVGFDSERQALPVASLSGELPAYCWLPAPALLRWTAACAAGLGGSHYLAPAPTLPPPPSTRSSPPLLPSLPPSPSTLQGAGR